MPSMEYEHVSQEIATAVWWPAETGEGAGMQAGGTRGRGGRRVLLGEIHLSSNLKPSSRLGRFELSVRVASLEYAHDTDILAPHTPRLRLRHCHVCLVHGCGLLAPRGGFPARRRRRRHSAAGAHRCGYRACAGAAA